MTKNESIFLIAANDYIFTLVASPAASQTPASPESIIIFPVKCSVIYDVMMMDENACTVSCVNISCVNIIMATVEKMN